VLGAAFVGVVGLVAMLMLSVANARPAEGAVEAEAPVAVIITPQETALYSEVSAASLAALNIQPWDGKRRLTVLLMGLDKRPDEQGTGFRTDTLILLSLDPATGSVGMLSIPRDVRVPIPNRSEMQPINAAYVYGELERPGYGPRLTLETVQYNLGMPIDHYVVLSFDAVISLIDAIGGITVEVPKEILDTQYPDMFYGVETLYIPAGTVEMDGALALKYARTRHQDTDFDRTRRQQQVILAIRQRIVRADVLPGLLPKAPLIWDTISRGVITDLSFEQALSLGWYAKDIPVERIQRGAIDERYIQAVNINGETVLTINRGTVAELMTAIFGPDYNQ
jgi:LCP family protein required for cell wall assembly